MTSKTLEMQNKAPKTSFLKRHRLKLIGVAVFLLLSTQMPLLGYLGRVVVSVLTFGISSTTVKSIEVQTDWFMRYFTGPPSDAEMIAFFREHQQEFERMADIGTNKSRCDQDQECARIATNLNLGASSAALPHAPNLACRSLPQPKGYGMQFCHSQEYYLSVEPQDWWKSNNNKIEAWEKSYVYVAPHIPAERLGLNPRFYPHDPAEVMRRRCYLVEQLDTIPAELEAKPDDYKDCAARHIGGQWFIRFYPITKNPKN